jgi:hypothetical protein
MVRHDAGMSVLLDTAVLTSVKSVNKSTGVAVASARLWASHRTEHAGPRPLALDQDHLVAS